MAFFRVATHIEAPPARVWELLADWEGSAHWMVDATSVEVVGAQRAGVGTKIRAVTTIAGVKLVDVMEVVRWEDERLIAVMHHGWPIRGLAWFEMRPSKEGTWFEWAEELDPPLGPVGEFVGIVLKRGIERVLRTSVSKLKQLAEAAA